MSGTPGLGEMITMELYAPGGGGLRSNNLSIDTSIDGKRETLRSFVRDYGGQQVGSNVRKISLKEFVDFDFLNGGFDPETEFLAGSFLVYRMTMIGSGRIS